MILQRLRIAGFGGLHGEWRFDPARVNLICGENERGKTTLAAAITAALFGLEGDKRGYRDGTSTPLEHYRPWNGRPYALELEFDARGKRYVVTRHFGNNKLTVLEDGRDATEEFRHGSGEYKVGEELLGLSGPEQFARTALSLQAGPSRLGGDDVRPDSSLTTLLEGMASSVTGDASSTHAIRLLDEALRSYKGHAQQSGMVANEIKKLTVALGTAASDPPPPRAIARSSPSRSPGWPTSRSARSRAAGSSSSRARSPHASAGPSSRPRSRPTRRTRSSSRNGARRSRASSPRAASRATRRSG